MRKRTGLNILSFCRKDDKSGHDGSLSTGHANSCEDMLKRIETMVLMGMELPLEAVQAQIAAGIDVLVHLGRLRDKTRKVLDIMEVTGFENHRICIKPLYRFREMRTEGGKVIGCWEKVGELESQGKLQAAGII